jgi:hypothetical protein
MAAVAAEEQVDFVDARPYLRGELREPVLDGLRSLLAAPPSAAPDSTERGSRSGDLVEVVLEVAVPSRHPGPVTVVGNHPALGSGKPGAVRLSDDGLPPDRHGGDGVHTLRVQLPGGARLRYLYQVGAEPGSWQGLESAATYRVLRVPPAGAGGRAILRARFGRVPNMREPIHPSETGYHGVALLVADRIGIGSRLPSAPDPGDPRRTPQP